MDFVAALLILFSLAEAEIQWIKDDGNIKRQTNIDRTVR
jgi:hypothetical protein